MAGDDLDNQVQRAAEVDAATVERVVSAALAGPHRGRARARSFAFAALSVAIVGVLGIAGWWMWRSPTPPGVYRVYALPAPPARPPEADLPRAAGDAVYRVEADRTPPPSRVIRVSTSDGATWILSTGAADELPIGTAIVVGGEEKR